MIAMPYRRPWSSKMALIALLGAAFLLAQMGGRAHGATGDVVPYQNTWITNGFVDSIVTDGSTCYIGGSFSRVGPCTGNGVPVDTTGNPVQGFAKVNGQVLAVAADGNGGWYIGGSFTSVSGTARNGLAHILANGALDGGWDPAPVYGSGWSNFCNAQNEITAIAVNYGKIYVAGNFTAIGGENRNSLAALDSTGAVASWNPLGAVDSLVFMGQISALAVSVDGRTVYVGGAFSFTEGGRILCNLAAFDAAAGVATTCWTPNPDSGVYALALSSDGATLYAGGDFQTIWSNCAALPHLAAIGVNATDSNTFGVANTAWAPNPDGDVYALALSSDSTTLYVGGEFQTIGSNGAPDCSLAAVGVNPGDATKFGIANTGWASNPDGPVFALALSSDSATLFVGGWFAHIGGQSRNCAASLNASNGTVTNWDPEPYFTVNALAAAGNPGNLATYIGGDFSGMGGVARNNLAAIDSTGRATSWTPNPDSYVYALALSPDGNTLYAGGDFQTIGSNAASLPYLAAVGVNSSNSTTFGIADTSWAPSPSGDVETIALSLDGNTLFAGGSFTTIGSNGAALSNLAAIGVNSSEPATFGVADASWAPDPDNQVCALALSPDGSTLYAGGYFDWAGGQSRTCLAAIDSSTGLCTAWNPGVSASANPVVSAIAVGGNTVYVGGSFSQAGGLNRSCLAAIDAASGQAMPWSGGASGTDWATVDTLALSGGTLYVGGYFQNIGGRTRNNLAALDPSTGVAQSWDPEADDQVYTIAVSGNTVYAGGYFKSIGQYELESFAGLSALQLLWQDATDLGGGWKWLSWFGCFYTGCSQWIYHTTLGWLYPIGTSTENIWFWDSGMNCVWWTSQSVYPWVYRKSDSVWLYYLPGSSNPRWFYNTGAGKWESD